MKKEYLILIILIIGLSAYLGFKKDDQVHYELPAIAKVDTTRIDRIEIQKADRLVVLNKGEDGWTVTNKKFAAKSGDIKQMLDMLEEIRLSALVSEARDLTRYELDDAHAVKIKAMAKGQVVRSIATGKTAPSRNHTFICLNGRSGDQEGELNQTVYQANGNFKPQFDKDAADFRDKKVLAFAPDSIKKITLEKQGQTVSFIKAAKPETADPEKKKTQKDSTAEKKEAKEAIWKNEDGSAADQKIVSDLLSSLSTLECQAFMDDDKAARLKEKHPSCKILLENDATFVLNLFDKNNDKDVEGSCSYTPYAFTLTSYKADDIVSYTDKLLGIEKQQDSTEPE